MKVIYINFLAKIHKFKSIQYTILQRYQKIKEKEMDEIYNRK